MKSTLFRALPVALLGLVGSGCAPQAKAAASVTKLVQTDGRWQLTRDGKPYFIKGAGGGGPLPLLHERGGNSNRTWGADNISDKLDEAQKLGMTYTVGIWLGHTEHGFNYADEKAVAGQFEKAKAAIDRYKDHPAVLAWGIGNEMEGYKSATDPKMWAAVQQIAAYAHRVDPNHPTMTVVAEIGGDRVKSINTLCPDVDIIGINSYGGAPSIPERYAKAGGVKPYVLTEFGPPGTWETPKNEWGAARELSSTAKAEVYASTWNKTIKDQPLALGGYAFTWGSKQEATATWYGMLLPDGNLLGAADAMTQIWTGTLPAPRVPEIKSLKADKTGKAAPGDTIEATLDASDANRDALKVEWILQHDPMIHGINGQGESKPPTFPDAIITASNTRATVKMPPYQGAYRLFAYVYDGKGGAAVANVPLFVEGGEGLPANPTHEGKLPVAIIGEDGASPYVASGYMGNAGAIKMNPNDTTLPHSGKTSTKVEYRAWFGLDTTTNSYKSNGQFSYASASVALKYDPVPGKPYFVAHIDAQGLKPNFCYQLKLVGKPVHGDRGMTTQFSNVDLNGQPHAVGTSAINGDDWANEQIGFAGRWWDDDNAAPGTNLDDSFYLNNYKNKVAANPNDTSTHPIYGYLFMGSFVSQADGTAHVDLTGQSSYHIDWPSWQGGAPIEHFRSPYSVAAESDLYGYDYTPAPSQVRIYYETQRSFAGSDSGGDERSVRVAMPAGTYHCRFLLTEESFHSVDAGGGYWKSVLVNEDFTRNTTGKLIPDSDASNDIVFTVPPHGLTAAASTGKVDLSWPSSNGVASYNIKRRDAAGGAFVLIQSGVTAQTTTATFTDRNVVGGTTYTYAVSAVSSSEGIESANSNEAPATTPAVNAAPVNAGLNPNRVASAPQTPHDIIATYSDANGAGDMTLAALRIGGNGRNSSNALLCIYNATTDKLSIYNDAANALIGSATPGDATVLTNSQGALNCAGVTTSKSGNTLTINWNVSLTGAFAGTKQNVFLFVRDTRGLSDGYDNFGTWTTTGNARPINKSVLPASATDSVNSERVFTASYYDANGWKNLSYVTLRLGGSGTGNAANNDNAMVCVYNVQLGKLYLFDDFGDYVPQAAFPGSNVMLSNSQGSLNAARCVVSGSGNTLTVQWCVKASSAGSRNIALICRDRGGLGDGYDTFGTWTIVG